MLSDARNRHLLTLVFGAAALVAWAVSHDAAQRKARRVQRRASAVGRIAVEDMRWARAANQRRVEDILADDIDNEGGIG